MTNLAEASLEEAIINLEATVRDARIAIKPTHAEPLKDAPERTPEPLPDQLFMYCPACGWMNNEEGVGAAECPRCVAKAHWVKGTPDELAAFRSAIDENPQNWKNFRCTDYWIGTPEHQP